MKCGLSLICRARKGYNAFFAHGRHEKVTPKTVLAVSYKPSSYLSDDHALKNIFFFFLNAEDSSALSLLFSLCTADL